MTEQEVQKDQKYFEVDIEYVTGAKMVLLGTDSENIRDIVLREFSDIPQLNILSIQEADESLVEEAKARRAFEDAAEITHKEKLN